MGYVHLRPRPYPLNQDEEKRKDFKDKLSILNSDDNVEIWYSDESGVEGDPRSRRIIAKKGSRPVVYYKGAHIKENIIGAVRPKDGEFVSLLSSHVTSELFQAFLNELQKHISNNKKVIMVLDNASWHKVKKLNWGRIEPFYLPPYSPDLNPIERIWLDLKAKFFTLFVANNKGELVEKLCEALNFYYDNPEVCKSICYR